MPSDYVYIDVKNSIQKYYFKKQFFKNGGNELQARRLGQENNRMKEYRIKDLSEMLGISKEMIRYYEKCGAVSPDRDKDNNYRKYSIMDYFQLAEAISLAQFDTNIKDVYELKNNDYSARIKEVYARYIEETEKNIAVEKLMIKRAEELMDRMMIGEMNR